MTRILDARIRRIRPAVVAFVGVTLYQYFFGLAASGGAGAKPETIHEARVFVLPNPSGLNWRDAWPRASRSQLCEGCAMVFDRIG